MAGEGAAAAPAESVGYGELLRANRDFRFLWLGQVVSLFGDWFNLVAAMSLVAMLTRSGAAVGALFAVRMLAPFLVSPVAGVVADRINRKRLLILTDLVRAVVVLGFLLVRDAGDVWLLYVLTALQMGVSGFFYPGRNAILPSLVSERELGPANALSAATWSVMLALGMALGGVVAGEFGAATAFVVDSLTFCLSAACIARIRYAAAPPKTDGPRRGGFHSYVDGLRYLGARPSILAITLNKAALMLSSSGAMHVVVVRLGERIHPIGEGGAVSMGLLFGVMGLGTGIGPILARRITGDREAPQRFAIALGFAIAGGGVALVASLPSFAAALAGVALRGFGAGLVWVFSTELLMRILPGEVRGRVFATEFALLTLMNATAAALGGGLIDQPGVGVPGLLWGMVGLSLLAGLLWGASGGRSGTARGPAVGAGGGDR